MILILLQLDIIIPLQILQKWHIKNYNNLLKIMVKLLHLLILSNKKLLEHH